jgi:hypothetical protein
MIRRMFTILWRSGEFIPKNYRIEKPDAKGEDKYGKG